MFLFLWIMWQTCGILLNYFIVATDLKVVYQCRILFGCFLTCDWTGLFRWSHGSMRDPIELFHYAELFRWSCGSMCDPIELFYCSHRLLCDTAELFRWSYGSMCDPIELFYCSCRFKSGGVILFCFFIVWLDWVF